MLSVLRPKFSGVLGEALDVAVRWSGDVVSTNIKFISSSYVFFVGRQIIEMAKILSLTCILGICTTSIYIRVYTCLSKFAVITYRT